MRKKIKSYGRYPYLGIDSYQDRKEDRLVFFGRDKEKKNLFNKVMAEDLTLLFARSGVGKTSLINAALVEEMRIRSFFPIVCRVTHAKDEGPIQSIYSCIEKETEEKKITLEGEQDKQNFWSYFFTTKFLKNGHLLRPIIIIDQFEELFTSIRTHEKCGRTWEKTFIEQLADLVRHRIPFDIKKKYLAKLEELSDDDPERRNIVSLLYEGGGPEIKILLAVREDALPELEALKDHIPNIFANAMRLDPFNIEQAREAINKPCQQKEVLGNATFLFESDAVDEILQFLSLGKKTQNLGQETTIEPTHLSILCRRLNEKRIKKRASTITKNDLGGYRGIKRLLRLYYQNIMKRIPRIRLGWNKRKFHPFRFNYILFNRPRAAVRKLCEKGLITATGYRNSLIIQVIQRSFGVIERDLNKLVNLRLIRSEPRLGSIFYELSHDSMVEPLRTSSRRRRLVNTIFAFFMLPVLASVLSLMYLNIAGSERIYYEQKERLQERAVLLHNELRFESNPKNRSELLKKLGDQGWKDFSYMNLKEVHVTDLNLGSAEFKNADLTSAWLLDSGLGNANFINAKLFQADLSGSNLENAIFDGAVVESINLDNTNWWLAFGWPQDQFEKFKNKWPCSISLSEAIFYKGEIGRLTILVSLSSDEKEKSAALNNLAWYHTIHGINLDIALDKINQALELSQETHEYLYAFLGTRGYILLQMNRHEEAKLELENSIILRPTGESLYHLALVRERLGQTNLAKFYFAKAEEYGYAPSYERLLTPRQDQVQIQR